MKKKLITLLAAATLTVAGYSQTNTVPDTNWTTVPIFLGQTWDFLVGQGITNLTTTVYGTYTPDIKKWGGGLVLTRNLPLGGGLETGIGLGVDWYDRNFYALNGQVSLQARIKPFASWGTLGSKIELTPFTFVGIGTPFGEGADGTGNVETILAGGAALHLFKAFGGDVSISGIYGTREGLGDASGTFYGGGFNWGFKF